MPTSHASAIWEGAFKDGKGTYRAESGAFSGTYTAATRFEGAAGTNPEELLAAAHAGCFSMALAAGLTKAGHPPTRIATRAACTIEPVKGTPTITRIALSTRGTVPGIDGTTFKQAADEAKANCPVSRLFKGNVEVTLQATLE